MDQLDKKILMAMQEDGRMTNTQMANKFGVSESTIRNHVNYLLESRIMKVRALINPDYTGENLVCVVGFHVKSNIHKVSNSLKNRPAVFYLATVTGRFDLIAFVVIKNKEELSSFLNTVSSDNPDITGTETFINLEIAKNPWLEAWGTRWIMDSLDES
jgi:Lrp/AsnC family transcriptional regulator, regulator for asnA, asnC and gidA